MHRPSADPINGCADDEPRKPDPTARGAYALGQIARGVCRQD
ncbi:MAG: hypothetical protein ACJ74W_16245 [Pyrinomonadaceae bacterium]